MNAQEKPRKAVVSVVEMAAMLDLSKSRFYSLMQAGIFPTPIRQSCNRPESIADESCTPAEPIQHESYKRPVFDLELQQRCLDIRSTGIGANGQPVLFNRKRRKPSQPKPRSGRHPVTEEDAELIEALKSLGLTATAEEVQAALRELYPDGSAGIDQGEIVRRVFLHLRRKK
jgi:hypothetical protein